MMFFSFITNLFAILLGLAVFPFVLVTAAPLPYPAPQDQGFNLGFSLTDIGLASRQLIKTNLPTIALLGLGQQNHQVTSSSTTKAARALLDSKAAQRRQLDRLTFVSALLTDLGIIAPAGDE